MYIIECWLCKNYKHRF